MGNDRSLSLPVRVLLTADRGISTGRNFVLNTEFVPAIFGTGYEVYFDKTRTVNVSSE
jgi:hypothetical protein